MTTSARRTASLSPDRACRAIVLFRDQERTPPFDKVLSCSFPAVSKFLQKQKTVLPPSGTSEGQARARHFAAASVAARARGE